MANNHPYKATDSEKIVCRVLNITDIMYVSKYQLIELVVMFIEQLFYENPDHPIFKMFKETELAALRLNRINQIAERINFHKKELVKKVKK